MARWIGWGALALAWATVAAGQTPAPAPAASGGPRVGEVMTFRTSGQPDRRVRITRVVGTPDTDGLADVEDLGTGAKYAVPLKVAAMMARASFADAPAAPAAAAPTLKPGSASPLPSVAHTLPRVPPPAAENGWPRNATPPPVAPAAVAAKPRPASVPANRPAELRAALPPPTTVRNAMRADTPPPAAAPAAAPTPVPAFTLSRAKFDPPVPPPAPARRPAVSVEPSETVVAYRAVPPTVAVEADETRVVAASATRPPDPSATRPPQVAVAPPEPSGIRSPQVAVAPPEYVVVPVLEYSPATVPPPVAAAPVAVAAVTPPMVVAADPPTPDRYGPPPVTPLAEPRAATDAPVAAPPPAVAPPPALVPPVVVEASRVVPAAPAEVAVRTQGIPAQMLEEVQPFVNDLFQALRPSSRERAATALAEGRYGGRAEVKATLARAALIDPAPSVRAHCITQLARLGYHESSYVGYLDACAESGHDLVKKAATDALARLVSRN